MHSHGVARGVGNSYNALQPQNIKMGPSAGSLGEDGESEECPVTRNHMLMQAAIELSTGMR